MKKYCHVLFEEYPWDPRVRRYVNTLVQLGYSVYIICIANGVKKFYEKQDNVYIYRIPLAKRRKGFISRLWEYIVFEVVAFLMVSYLHIKNRINIYHVHTLPDFLVFSCLLPKLLGSKIILDFHELFPEFMMQHRPHLKYSSMLIKIILFQERISFNFAEEVIVFHDPAREILLSRVRTNRNATTIMNGIDESEFPQVINKPAADEFKIIYNGTINFNLNLPLIIKALSILKTEHPQVYKKISFELYGDGPDLENLLSTAKEYGIENVYYKGRLDFRNMMLKLQEASLCILPPKKDIYSELYYSLKLIEVIYLRIPVIATRLKTYLYYFPEDSIFYFDSEDIAGLADRILEVYFDKEKVLKYTCKALEYYQKNNWHIMKDKYEKLVMSLNN